MSIIKNIENSIYRINTGTGAGTGFYSKKHDIFVTNFHVVAGSLEVSIEDKDRNRYLATVIYSNPGKDIAFLKSKDVPTPTSSVNLEHKTACSARDKVMVLGFPFGMPFTVTEGIVSNPTQVIYGERFIQTDAAVNPGNSGGPMVNEAGELVGIVTSKFDNADNMGFAIPYETLVEELEIVGDLQDNVLTVGCHSCNGLMAEKTAFCPNCGTDVDPTIFEANPISEIAVKVENAINKLEVNPILARSGYDYWKFHQGSAEVRIFIYQNNYLIATSPLNDLPRTKLDAIYNYILTEDTAPFTLSISDNKIYISYRVHISDLYSDQEEKILSNLANLAKQADDFDNLFVEKFGAKMTHYSKEMA